MADRCGNVWRDPTGLSYGCSRNRDHAGKHAVWDQLCRVVQEWEGRSGGAVGGERKRADHLTAPVNPRGTLV